MKAFFDFLSRLFRRKSAWDGYDYGKPSTAQDDFRKENEI